MSQELQTCQLSSNTKTSNFSVRLQVPNSLQSELVGQGGTMKRRVHTGGTKGTQISLPLVTGDAKSPIRSVLEETVQRISNDWFQKARRNSLLTRLFQIRSKEISQANLTGASVWIGRHTRAHAGSRSLQHERGPSICSPSALRSTPPQSTIHSVGRRAPILSAQLPAPSPLPSAPSGIGLGAGWVVLTQPLISASSSQFSCSV